MKLVREVDLVKLVEEVDLVKLVEEVDLHGEAGGGGGPAW